MKACARFDEVRIAGYFLKRLSMSDVKFANSAPLWRHLDDMTGDHQSFILDFQRQSYKDSICKVSWNSISPNPTSDNITVNADFEIERIEIYDTKGIRQSIKTNRQNNEINISTSVLPSGMYLLKIYTGNRFETVKIEVVK